MPASIVFFDVLCEDDRDLCGTPFRERMFGLINDDSTPVGAVHLGVVHLLELDRPAVRPRETDIGETGFAPLADLLKCADEFESWSRLAMAHSRHWSRGPRSE